MSGQIGLSMLNQAHNNVVIAARMDSINAAFQVSEAAR
jgi:hypothetical protein